MLLRAPPCLYVARYAASPQTHPVLSLRKGGQLCRYTAVMNGTDFQAIARKHGARLLLQFGSTVTGREHAKSDVDLAVLFEGDPTFSRLGALLADVESAFPGRTVDLALLNRADPLFLKKVLESARLLAGTARELAELRLRAFRRYQDHRRYLALEREFMDRFLGERTAH